MNRCSHPRARTPISRAIFTLLAFATALAVHAATGTPTVLVNDTFSDGERATQSPPNSLAWFSSGGSTTMSVANGGLILTLSGGRHTVAYFPEKSLAIGESIELAFDFRTTAEWANQASGLRFGLFATNGTDKITADAQNPTTITYTGYAVTTNAAPTAASPSVLRERGATANALITSTTSYTAMSGGSGGPIATFTAGSTYRATLLMERLDTDSVRVTCRYTGGSLPTYEVTSTDTSGAVTKFDTIAIAVGSTSGVAAVTEITMDNVTVTHYGVPPPTPPTITTQPTPVTVLLGDTALLSIAASGSAPLTYQWYQGANAVQGGTSSTLTIPNVQVAQGGTYTVKVSNAAGDVTSDPVVLTVDTTPVAPTMTLQPFSQNVASGGSVTLSARAAGSSPFTYQWFRNGIALANATSSSLSLSNVTSANTGAYTVVVTNAAGSLTSNAALVAVASQLPVTSVLNDTFSGANISTQSLPTSAAWLASSNTAPTLALQSGALLVPAGRHALAYFTDSGVRSLSVGDELAATFVLNFSTVGNSSGGLRMGFFNSNGSTRSVGGENTSFANYDGLMVATTARFPDDGGAITGSLGVRARVPGTSATALISTTTVYGTPVNINGNNQSLEAGVNYTFRLSVVRSASDKLRVTLQVTGGTLAPYGMQLEIPSALSGFDSFAILSTSTAGSTFTLDNFDLKYTAAPTAVAPTILTQPLPARVNPSASVTFTADATGVPVPSFQWRKDGVAIDGATKASYNIASVLAGDAGSYDVVVTNSAGSVPSNTATLSVAGTNTISTWRQTNFGTTTATGNAADLADPDGDGLVNLVEYALGFDPNARDSVAVPAAAVSGTDWVFNYVRPVSRPDVTYVVQVSTDLQNWSTVNSQQVAVSGETATWQATYPQSGNARAFFRLSVTVAAP